MFIWWFGWVYAIKSHLYFGYMVTVSFIGGGNRSTCRKPPTCGKSLKILGHNVVSSTPRHEWGSNSQQ